MGIRLPEHFHDEGEETDAAQIFASIRAHSRVGTAPTDHFSGPETEKSRKEGTDQDP